MTVLSTHTIVNVGYRSTNYWVVGGAEPRLLVDIGWPGTLGTMRAALQRNGILVSEIRYALATHYHIDHAGLAEEIKREGVSLLVIDVQSPAIPIMKTWMKPADHYVEITDAGNVTITVGESRPLLAQLGISGQILHTPGHTDDSISLLLDDGSAFTGDLPPEEFCWDNPRAEASWRLLRDSGATQVYPAHGPARQVVPQAPP